MARKPHAHSGLPGQATYDLLRLREEDPTAFKTKIRAALEAQGGSIPLAAGQLSVSVSTLRRWIDRDTSLAKGIELATGGWPKGNPRKPQGMTKKSE